MTGYKNESPSAGERPSPKLEGKPESSFSLPYILIYHFLTDLEEVARLFARASITAGKTVEEPKSELISNSSFTREKTESEKIGNIAYI